MSLKITKIKGRKFYYIVGTLRGRRIRRSAATTIRAIAEEKKSKLEWDMHKRETFGDKAVATFTEAAASYLRAGGDGRFLAQIIDQFREYKLTEMTQQLIDETGNQVYAGRAPSTLRRQWHGPISAVFNHASEHLDIPLKKVKRPPESANRIRWLWPEQAAEIALEVTEMPLKAAALTILGCGGRSGEVANLDWNEVYMDSGQALLLKTKNGHQRMVELPSLSRAAISTLDSQSGKVFRDSQERPYESRLHSGGRFNKELNDALREASVAVGLEPVTAHILRHTWATWFYAQTKDLLRLQTLGGWSSLKMVEVYAHNAPRELAQKVAEAGWDFSGFDTPATHIAPFGGTQESSN